MLRKLFYGIKLSSSVAFTAVLFASIFVTESKAQPTEGCPVAVCASIPGLPPPESKDEAIFFEYEYTDNLTTETFEVIANVPMCPTLIVPEFGAAIITQFPRGRWSLESVDCEGPGTNFIPVENGVLVACDNASDEVTTCTFVNQSSSVNIPTMSEWGMAGVAGALGLIGVFYAARRRRAAA
ncbi:MAG: IPTL-CTERM sorting domain-containing protein [Sinomicrobium sp.]|nr:IPTL-CTERM sorting domain-containing protein [Sinomicrobium sp.]